MIKVFPLCTKFASTDLRVTLLKILESKDCPISQSGFAAFTALYIALVYAFSYCPSAHELKDVQELLGHSDVHTIMNVYAHGSREAKRNSARLLDKVVGLN